MLEEKHFQFDYYIAAEPDMVEQQINLACLSGNYDFLLAPIKANPFHPHLLYIRGIYCSSHLLCPAEIDSPKNEGTDLPQAQIAFPQCFLQVENDGNCRNFL